MNSDEKRGVERFRRIKDDEIKVDHRLQDNSFEAKVSVRFYKKARKEKNKRIKIHVALKDILFASFLNRVMYEPDT